MAVEAVMKNIKSDDGELKSYIVLNKKVTEQDEPIFTYKGKNYTKEKLQDGTYIYMLPTEGEEVQVEPKKETKEPTSVFLSYDNSKYDRGVDSLFDFFDRLIGTDNSNLTEDGQNDGKIGFWEGAKRFFKGAVLKPLKTVVKHPLISIGASLGICSIVAVAPIALTIFAAVGAVAGLFMVGKGIYKAKNAKTDAEARAAWEDIGEGSMTAFLSYKALGKLAPKDGMARSGIRKFAHNFRVGKVTKEGKLQRLKNFKDRHWYAQKADQDTAKTLLTEAKTAITKGNLSTAKTKIAQAKSMAAALDDNESILTQLKSVEKLYNANKFDVPWANQTYVMAGVTNWTDDSALDIQKLYDAAPAFAS